MKISGKITMLFSEEGLSIEVADENAGITFATIRLNQEQTCQALSRLSRTDCTVEVRGLEHVGKVLEIDTMTFALPSGTSHDKDVAKELAQNIAPSGWKPDLYFGSQNSFFKVGDVGYARCSIRRWVDKEKTDDQP